MISKKMPKFFLLLIVLVSVACSKTEDNVPLNTPTTQIVVDKLVRKASLINQEIPFTITSDSEAGEITDLVFYVNGEPIEGTSFSSDTIGDFEVYAVYMQDGVEVTTNTETFSVIIPKRKVVVEDYTGTWCGFCPRVAGAIYSLSEETDDITVVAIHETNNNFPEPMHFGQIQLLKDAFGVDGLPAARLNRTEDWAIPHPNSAVTSMAGLDTNLAIAINSEVEEGELQVQVNVVYEEGSVQGDKLVVYLLEDGIISDQFNYYNDDATSPFYNMGDIIPDFEHNEVLRNSLSSLLGDAIPVTAELTEHIWSNTMTLPSNYVEENLSIVAMVVSADNTAKNSQHAHVGEDKSYE
ncbi:Omp28-related outer membrane protein [Winogradskyella psychrotolerans]|uniref:Omp28-related outer membrane protein n=1 Tax=Winogradskyella psychrotolerans TaxID=1344585 RepID=UPI001C076A52|nr:Omp28-related outer membrane protein [Winogradskyella psychrotolerans]MBU2922904.1 Omp28-related outer membrane protein [Winogradskyella psychrotolerans]|eukprot:TRINITY_DN8003_c0_g2_i1.p1 TRINITY_DN8003_c0_g2~~TRINITY_DN8003_c0_g2_i1.p1  ORF type:complete len:352 (+),score=73.76 TRINITY_DN8003_c0_g2_i1:179-1234(+)